jgi:hypothetical protein
VASLPVDKRTSTHFLLAELGFFGFLMTVRRTTPLAWGLSAPNGFFFFGRFEMIGPIAKILSIISSWSLSRCDNV